MPEKDYLNLVLMKTGEDLCVTIGGAFMADFSTFRQIDSLPFLVIHVKCLSSRYMLYVAWLEVFINVYTGAYSNENAIDFFRFGFPSIQETGTLFTQMQKFENVFFS